MTHQAEFNGMDDLMNNHVSHLEWLTQQIVGQSYSNLSGPQLT